MLLGGFLSGRAVSAGTRSCCVRDQEVVEEEEGVGKLSDRHEMIDVSEYYEQGFW